MLQLKNYQKDSIEYVGEFLSEALIQCAEHAFIEKKQVLGKWQPTYNTHGLGDIPYFCLRIPTGGGKTLVAAHLIRNVAHDYLLKSNMFVLWLVPTSAILNQTLSSLRNPRHPYREAIEDYFGNNVEVYAITEIESIKPDILENDVCIVVGTIQSFRIGSKDGRVVYDHWEAFEQHFTDLKDIPEHLDKDNDGNLKFSFANVCSMHKPLVIMDEAHNARTKLSFETFRRLSPSCIIELTATPDISSDTGSNVLLSVTALQLKAEDMIKLPIILTEHQSWQAAVSGTVITRRRLQEESAHEDEYIRPLALYQAQHKDQQITYQMILDYLMEQEDIPRGRIAIATGEVRELDGVDLFSPDCEIEHIITVEALKEGWDCSFAYVFCSVTDRSSQKDVEQILGRVLRMPYATKRKQALLNYAYAHVSSSVFAESAKTLQDTLVDKLGFEDFEAKEAVKQISSNSGNEDQMDLFTPERITKIEVLEIDVSKLDDRVKANIEIKSTSNGQEITIKTELDAEIEKQLLQAVPQTQRNTLSNNLARIKAQSNDLGRIIRAKIDTIKVPQLMFVEDEYIAYLDNDDFLEYGQWDINRFPADLPEFAIVKEDSTWNIDVDTKSKVMIRPDKSKDQVLILPHIDELSFGELVIWLDKNITHKDIPQVKALKFINDTLENLLNSRGMNLGDLILVKFVLAKAIEMRINQYRDMARKDGFQALISETNENLIVEFKYSYEFNSDPVSYPVSQVYESGRYSFNKHFYNVISDMNTEEAECALQLDTHPKVKHWIRNLERKPTCAFWLPTSTDRFYPDFVAELTDGRLLVVEYKGEQLRTSDDTKEKALVGKVWEKQSKGKCLFLLATKNNNLLEKLPPN
jgi:type III restriction enzyme